MTAPPYLVRVLGVTPSGESFSGTGFVVSPQGHVVTCLHVVSPTAGGFPDGGVSVCLPYTPPWTYRLLDSIPEQDIALLEGLVPPGVPTPYAALQDDWRDTTSVGDPLTVWGYSAAENYAAAQQFACTVSGFSENNGRIGLNGDINPGDSGAPVLNAQGRVIGIAQVRDQKRGGQAMAIPVSPVPGLLKRHSILIPPAGGKKPAAKADRPKAHLSLYVADVSNKDDVNCPELDVAPLYQLGYGYTREQGEVQVSYRLPYLDLARQGGPVAGVVHSHYPFDWQFPQVSVKLVNNGDKTILLAEAVVKVLKSEVVDEPVLILDDLTLDDLVITNEGWGTVVDPELEFSVSDPDVEGDALLFAVETHQWKLETFADRARVPVAMFVPSDLRRRPAVRVSGQIRYGPPEQRKALAFTTRVALSLRAGHGVPPTFAYDVFFKAGEAPATRLLDISQEIRPGTADHFLLQLGTDKTSRSRLSLAFRTADGETVSGDKLTVDLFVPRTQRPETRRRL